MLASGGSAQADLYIDCSGFRSALLGRALGEPFIDFGRSLFCDRAIVGGWERSEIADPANPAAEPIQPFTTAETMDAGWCFRIDHERRINRGYVYASAFISDEQAEAEFRAKNPKVATARVVRFASGHYRDGWVKNVVAVGNAYGFVEPLEATALAEICTASQNLAEILAECDLQPRPSLRALYNLRGRRGWEAIRRFLAIHYKFNTRLKTAFWRACQEETDLSSAEPLVEYYQENGPSTLYRGTLLDSTDQFGPDGYLAMFIGMRVPFRSTHVPSAQELQAWDRIKQTIRAKADAGLTAAEALAYVHHPAWRWDPNLYH
jgi:tryptophan halogenase